MVVVIEIQSIVSVSFVAVCDIDQGLLLPFVYSLCVCFLLVKWVDQSKMTLISLLISL